MNKAKQNEAIDQLCERGKKFMMRLNQVTKYEEPLMDSIIIADIPREQNNNLKSIDTIDKADVLQYSLDKINGSMDNSKLKDSISNSYVDSSSNGNSRFEGVVNTEGKFIKVDISQYKSLLLKYGKILFKNNLMNNSFVNNNDVLYLESKIPVFKAKSSGEIIYDTLRNYHQQGSDKDDNNNVVNINQSNTHKISLDEGNFAAITGSKIFIFLHKVTQGNFRKKTNGSKKSISSANSTEVIQNSDIIIGYCTLDMNKIFLSPDLKYSSKVNVVEKKKVVPKSKKNTGKTNSSGSSKRKIDSNDKNSKDPSDDLYDEKGERIIGTLDITCHLKRPFQKNILKEDKELKQITNSTNIKQSQKENKINTSNNQKINNNYISNNNFVDNIKNDNYQFDRSQTTREFIIGQPAAYGQQNNIIIDNNNNFDMNKINVSNMGVNEVMRQNVEEDIENKNKEEGVQEIHTDINGDILILYLKVNELKASNDNINSQNSMNNINNLSNINSQINNNMNKNNIIFCNFNGPQPLKRNFFIRHKIFPENNDASSETIWNKVSPDFNYTIQMPFTLNQRTAELLDNGKFTIEIWIKGENNNECLGIVSFDLRNVLEALKVDDNTITTVQLYKNTFPYIIYDDYYQVTQISEAPDLGALFLKTCIGVGTPSQVNSFINLIKKTQENTFNQYNNGLYNNISSYEEMNNQNEKKKNKEKNPNANDGDKNEENNSNNNISLDPFKEGNNKNINKEDINNVSKAADINVDGIMEKNHQELANVNLSKESSIFQKDTFKKSTSFDDQGNKPKIVNPFLVPKDYNQVDQNTKKDTGGFGSNFLSGEQKFNESNRYNNNYSINNYIPNEIPANDNKNININETKKVQYDINIIQKYQENLNHNTNNDLNPNIYNPSNVNLNIDEYKIKDIHENENNKFDYIKPDNNKEINININNYQIKKEEDNNNYIDKNNQKINLNNEEEENENENDGESHNFNYEKINEKKQFEYEEQKEDENEEINQFNELNREGNNNNQNENQFKDEFNINKRNPKSPRGEEKKLQIISNNVPLEKKEVVSSHVKKHIFTVSIEKIFNCQILSKLPPTYLRYQFFTDQKPLRSELFNFSSYSVDSSVIDVDMKSVHSIILPKVEKIKDYLNDFLVEFLYDSSNPNTIRPSRDDHVVIGRVNIPSDEFASLIGEKEIDNNVNENSRVLFIYGTEKIQRNKCIIGKLKLSFKYTCVDVPVSNNPLFNGSLSLSNNGLMNNFQQSNFGGSIYLEKETIFNRKIPKNACLKIYVKNFVSTSLFEDYFRRQFSICFVFSAFGEVSKMENQYGKRTTSKKHNLLNCDFNEVLSYKLEIDQDIIDYLKCRSGMVYLMYKVINPPKNYGLDKEINDEDEDEETFDKNINTIDLINLGNNKRIIGKGIYNLNDILTSADTSHQEINIAQIGNGSMSLGNLNIVLTLENDNNNANKEIEESDKEKNKDSSSPLDRFKKGLNNTTSDLYNLHNKSLNKCEPSFYLNGKFLFSIDFRKFYYEINSEIGSLINNGTNNFYFVFKLGNKIKKISPKINKDNNELYSLNLNCNLLLINYVEMIELDLNFNKKLPSDIYNLFNEGIFEIKLFQTDNANSLGSYYIDLHKLITSEFYSENLLYSGNNVINLIDVRNNTYKNSKIEVNLTIFKLNELQLNNDIMNKMNILNSNSNNIDNVNDVSVSNLDYCEYYQILFVKEFAESLIQNIFNDILATEKDKDKNTNLNESEQNYNINTFTTDKLKKIFSFNSIDMFSFIHNNLIPLIDNKGEINIINFKKIFRLITKLNYDIFEYYLFTKNENGGNSLATNSFDLYLSSKIINLDNEDMNVLNFLKDKQSQVDLGINISNSMNDKNNKTIKKLLTTKYNYGFNETNDYFDVVSLCLFLFDYFYNLNDNTLNNLLKLKSYGINNSRTQQPQNNFRSVNNINIPLGLSNNNNILPSSTDNNGNLLLYNNQLQSQQKTKVMVVSVLSGHNIIKPNSEFSSRPNCYFVLEFDDKNYTSDVVMNSSQPNFNEELEIKINSEDYVQKLNSLLIYINVFSFVDENGSIFIGKCEISPSKMFPFLNDNNECEDFFHIIGEEGQVMGQLNIKFKFEQDILGGGFTSKTFLNQNNNSILMSKVLPSQQKNGVNLNNTVPFPPSYVPNPNNKNKFLMTADMNDPLHKKLAEAMNTIDNLTQILQSKVQNKSGLENINRPKMVSIEDHKNIRNYSKYNKNVQQENLGEIKFEENINNNNLNDMFLQQQQNYEKKNFNEGENEYGDNNEMEMMNNEPYEEEQIDNYENKNLEDQLKMNKTDYDHNILLNSQKLSAKNEEEDKLSFYSDTKGEEKNREKKGQSQNYDKKLLNRIKNIMKNDS